MRLRPSRNRPEARRPFGPCTDSPRGHDFRRRSVLVRLEAADVVPLPAVHGNRDLGELVHHRVRVHSLLCILLLGDSVGAVDCIRGHVQHSSFTQEVTLPATWLVGTNLPRLSPAGVGNASGGLGAISGPIGSRQTIRSRHLISFDYLTGPTNRLSGGEGYVEIDLDALLRFCDTPALKISCARGPPGAGRTGRCWCRAGETSETC